MMEMILFLLSITLLATFINAQSDLLLDSVDDYVFCVTTHVDLGGVGSKGNISSVGFPLYMPDVSGNQPMCSMTIMSCKSCRITIQIQMLDFAPCDQYPHQGTCIYGCDHLMIYEIADPLRTTKYYQQGQEGEEYVSKTNQVFVKYCHSPDNNGKARRFQLQYTLYEKTQLFMGSIGDSGTFHSPGFPLGFSNLRSLYEVSEEIFYYHLHGLNGGYIRLSFDDWSLPHSSELKVYDGASKLDNLLFPSHLSRSRRGRPFLSSSSSDLLIQLSTGSGDEYYEYTPGFTARYSFVAVASWRQKPNQYCGQNLYDLTGGVLGLEDMEFCPTASYIDCVWVIWRYNFNHHGQVEFLSVRIDDLNLYNGDVLEVRSGNNSESEMVRSASTLAAGNEVLTRGDAIYIRLKARCSQDRRLRIVFTTYDDMRGSLNQRCTGQNMFLCFNQRCISRTLRCDGINHCNDRINYDEANCLSSTSERPCLHAECRGHRWYCTDKRCDGQYDCEDGTDEQGCFLAPRSTSDSPTPAPHYSFNAYHWGTIIPIVLICVVLAVIACVVVNYTRKRQLHRQRRRAAAQPQLGLPGQMLRHPEAPPTYEEAMYAGGILNRSFSFGEDASSLPPPPPYTIQAVPPSLPVQYTITPPPAPSTVAPSDEATASSGPLTGHGALGDMQVLLQVNMQEMRRNVDEPNKAAEQQQATVSSDILHNTPKDESSEESPSSVNASSANASSSYV